jgi:sialic acid synthase SpsE
MKTIKIGNKKIGKKYDCYVIAEIGSNFDGSLVKAKKLIKLAKESGADAAKFQSFKTELLLSKKGFGKKNAFQSNWKKSVWNTYKDAEFPRKWHKILNDYAKKIGIDFFTSPWDFDAVDILTNLDVPAIKIGSGDITYLDFLEYVGKIQKPILLATGASSMKEVETAVKTIKSTGNNKIILMHSVTQYPSPVQEANLKAITTLMKKFSLNVGYSDHSPGMLIPIASIMLGANVIEKHFTLNKNAVGPDHPHSMTPIEFKEMVQNIRNLKLALGNGIKKPVLSESETRIIQRRGLWTTTKITKGELFSRNNTSVLRPNIGISADKYKSLLGKKSKKQLDAFVAIKNSDF